MQDLKNLNQYQPRTDLLNNKVILVSGASDGIGRAAALSYAQHGATVILLGKTETKLNQVYDQIEAEGGQQPVVVPFDLSTADEANYQELARQTNQTFGRLDGLLHSAGVLGSLKPLEQYEAELFQEVMDINLRSNFLLTKAFLPVLHSAPSASIVFSSSSVGRKGRAYWGAYAISKFGIEGMMQTLADELGATSKIRCNSLNPRATETAMRRQAYPAEQPGTNPKPEDIMGAYLFLMGDDSLDINGQPLDAR